MYMCIDSLFHLFTADPYLEDSDGYTLPVLGSYNNC